MDKLPFNKDIFLGRVFAKIFGDNQFNVVYFAVSLAFPAIIMCIIGLIVTAWGNIYLMIFDILLLSFLGWALYTAFSSFNKVLNGNKKSNT